MITFTAFRAKYIYLFLTMIRPTELQKDLPMKVANDVISSTSKVWNMLSASHAGNLQAVKQLVHECPGLIYAQYNYAPPIHFAVREGHTILATYLLEAGALDPGYLTYPFKDNLLTIASERGHLEIAALLKNYLDHPELCRFSGDNGEINYLRSPEEKAFEEAVDKGDLEKTARFLEHNPGLMTEDTYFWGEGILTFAAKENDRPMIDLLMKYGAKVPDILKWAQYYYFEHNQGAVYMMEKGMNPNVKSWHGVTLLHDMAQKGNIEKAALLLAHGAELDPVDEEYQSTPLGMAARWGNTAMVAYLLSKGANPVKAGAPWATPRHWARTKNHKEIEKLLTDAGAL